MVKNNPHSVDKEYKTLFKIFRIILYLYFFLNGEEIEFKNIEIFETGQRKDIVLIVDKKIIKIIEIMSTPLYESKMRDLYDYYMSEVNDPENNGLPVEVEVISIAKPSRGITKVEIDKNINFKVAPIFLKNKNGQKVLNKLTAKTMMQEELSNDECMELLLLPDMDIEMPIKTLMHMIFAIITYANISKKMQTKLIIGANAVLVRFYDEEEIKEMVDVLLNKTQNPEAQKIVEENDYNLDFLYEDGYQEGKIDESIRIAKNLIAMGMDFELISQGTSFSIKALERLKREL